jgi:GTP cyclohydrolase II
VSERVGLTACGRRPIETPHGAFEASVLRETASGTPALVLSRGDPSGSAPLLARVHSSCITSESYGACDCDCALQLEAALGEIAREGRGVLFYLMQEGRGAGFAAKARDRMLVQASRHRMTTYDAFARMGLARDLRRYDAVREASERLSLRAPLVVLTNNPEKLAALEAAGVRIAASRSVGGAPHPWNRHYLASKSRSGHRLPATDGPHAELPGRVEPIEPRAARGAPSWLELASYLLPIGDDAGAAPTWFRLHLYATRGADREQVLLSHPVHGAARGETLVRVQHERLLDRVASRALAGAPSSWREARRAIVTHGSGLALFAPTRMPWDDAAPEPDPRALELVARHLAGRPARPLVASDGPGERDGAWLAAGLARLGVACLPPRRLERAA